MTSCTLFSFIFSRLVQTLQKQIASSNTQKDIVCATGYTTWHEKRKKKQGKEDISDEE